LQVEKFSATKREKILEGGDDRRYAMAKLIAKGWKAMDQSQHIKFIHTTRTALDGTRPKLVRSIQGAALVVSPQVRETLIPIFYLMIECEVAESMLNTPDRPNFDVMERELVDELDTCVSSGAGDQNYRWLFQQRMKALCQRSKIELIKTKGQTMVKSVIDLLQQLLALRDVPNGEATNDRRAGCMYALLDYYRERGLHNMAMRYVHRLVDVHYQSNHFTEAGFALKVHVDHLAFSDKKLPPLTDEDSSGQSFQRFPEQTERERRAELIEVLLECFDKGQTWENAISYVQLLADEYENATFEYAKLAHMHERIAGFWTKIVTADNQRLIPQFFKVGYFGGHDTPFGYRNVTFVYRANKQDHIKTFCDRIQSQFPKATILMKNTDPTEAMKASPDMSIMICKLTPEVDPKFVEEKFKGHQIPEVARPFYENNHIVSFTYSRPFRKGEKTGNECETLWTSNYRLQSQMPMPCLLNRAVLPDDLVEKVGRCASVCVCHAMRSLYALDPSSCGLRRAVLGAILERSLNAAGRPIAGRAVADRERNQSHEGQERRVEEFDYRIQQQHQNVHQSADDAAQWRSGCCGDGWHRELPQGVLHPVVPRCEPAERSSRGGPPEITREPNRDPRSWVHSSRSVLPWQPQAAARAAGRAAQNDEGESKDKGGGRRARPHDERRVAEGRARCGGQAKAAQFSSSGEPEEPLCRSQGQGGCAGERCNCTQEREEPLW
jgi:hypothetical protein